MQCLEEDLSAPDLPHGLGAPVSLKVSSSGHILAGGVGHEKEKAFHKLVRDRALSLISPLPSPHGKGHNCLTKTPGIKYASLSETRRTLKGKSRREGMQNREHCPWPGACSYLWPQQSPATSRRHPGARASRESPCCQPQVMLSSLGFLCQKKKKRLLGPKRVFQAIPSSLCSQAICRWGN